ncbi:MAG: DUF342 domain-containing protein [Deltaproteobacteria bacterium]|nr:DUF342 domain-containing protein [Deltaproteobacteria bacterium]
MAKTEIKLSYVRSQLQIRCEFTKTQCIEERNPPSDIINRVRKKVQEEVSLGYAAFFKIYDVQFQKVWTAFAMSDDAATSTINLVLAEGSPHLKGVKIKAVGSDKKYLAYLSIVSIPSTALEWPLSFLYSAVDNFLAEQREKRPVNRALVHYAWVEACLGKRVDRLGLEALTVKTNDHENFTFARHPDTKAIFAYILNRECIIKTVDREEFYQKAKEYVFQKSKETNLNYQMLFADLVKSMRAASLGMERLGIGLPFPLLIAMPVEEIPAYLGEKLIFQAADEPLKKPVQAIKKVKTELHFEFAEDNMEAKIVDFSLDLYDKHKIDTDWIQREFEKAGIVYGTTNEHLMAIEQKIADQESLDGIVVAVGKTPKMPGEPFLKLVFKFQPKSESGAINFREATKSYVRKGQLIAQIDYKVQGQNGISVLGEQVSPQKGETMEVTIGPGVREEKGQKFFAEADGIPIVSKNNISLQQQFIHEGDISLKTGDVKFTGDVIINGSILSGSTLEVKGNVQVTGGIYGARIFIHGNLSVANGISSMVYGHVTGKIVAKFIENSKFICLDEVTVTDNILNCEAYVKHTIMVQGGEKATIAGGTITCEGKIVCKNLGTKSGARTVIKIGSDLMASFRLTTLLARTERFQKTLNADKANLKELTSRSQLSDSHQKRKKELKDRVLRFEEILMKMNNTLKKTRDNFFYNKGAILEVHNTLHSNCEIRACDKPVPVKEEVKNVRAFFNGSQGVLNPLSEPGPK